MSKLWTAVSELIPAAQKRREELEKALKGGEQKIPGHALLEGLKAEILLSPFPPGPDGLRPAAYVDRFTGLHLAGGVRIDHWVETNPSFERTLWSLMTGRAPTEAEESVLADDLKQRRERFLASHALTELAEVLSGTIGDHHIGGQIDFMSVLLMVVSRLAEESHMACLIRGERSEFHGLEARFEDGLDLLAQLGVLAPMIATTVLNQSTARFQAQAGDLNFSESFEAGLEVNEESADQAARIRVLNTFFALMSYHGMGNVSTFASLVADSAGATLYHSYCALLAGLVAPNHGGACVQALRWLIDLEKQVGADWTGERLADIARARLGQKLPIWAVGHGLLRVREGAPAEDRGDPRTRAALKLGEAICADAPRFRLAKDWYAAAIPVVMEKKAIGFPEVNVDGYTGAIAGAVGLCKPDDARFPGGIFAVSRAMGMFAALFWNSAWTAKGNAPIIRPSEFQLES